MTVLLERPLAVDRADPLTAVTVALTGAAGSIGYAVAFRIASGAMLGAATPVRLRLLTTSRSRSATEAMALELEDCASRHLLSVDVHEEPERTFDGADVALLLASAPLRPGMTRRDLLKANAAIVSGHAGALGDAAADGVRVLVVSNPSNTSTLLAIDAAPQRPASAFSGLSRLDHDRGVSMIARHHAVPVECVSRLTIWGNHSDTQVPDPSHVLLAGSREGVDEAWMAGPMVRGVVERGHVVVAKRGTAISSTANAALRHVKDWTQGTPTGGWTSAAIASDGSYDVPAGLVSSFPVTSDGVSWDIVRGLTLSARTRTGIATSVQELIDERDQARALAPLR